MKSKIIAIGITILLTSCQQSIPKPKSINGNWESIGAGWFLQIQDSTTYGLYDTTAISCLPNRQAGLEEIITALSLTNDTLSMKKGVMTYMFTRAKQVPPLCMTSLTEEQQGDPVHNFDVFAQTVKEHYAFMELNNIHWQTLYEEQKRKLTQNPTEINLYNILEETFEKLNDNHAYLEASDALYEALEEATQEEESIAEDNLPEYGDFQIANMVAEHHLKEDMTRDTWLVKWGKMENNVGYIQLKAMWLYAKLDIPQSLIDEMGYVDAFVTTFHTMEDGQYIQKEREGITKLMDTIMNDLRNTNAMVIDVRFNGGGQDAVSFEILKRFNDQRRKTIRAKLKHEDHFSPEIPLYLDSATTPYTNPVYILTSPQTGSAAEAFAISSMAIPHHKRIGARTQGALSTTLEKTLPNGWSFSISNEIYMDLKGKSYENIGVPVDYTLPYPEGRQDFFRSVAGDLSADKQQILEAIKNIERQ
ncbi:MAG: carboxyl-terminal processing protease [Dokdonia sp.]|jgi:carboxyl-terminal processing protease